MISKRLTTIGDLLKEGSNVIDVGADHGVLEKYASKKVNKILAIENKTGPLFILSNAVRNLDNVEAIYGDGIDKIDDTIDTIVIAGVGGLLINSILEKNKDKLKFVEQIIVCPHKDNEAVRRYISSLGFKIDKEIIVFENNQYYIVMNFLRGENDYSCIEYEFGRLKDNDLFKMYVRRQIELLVDIFLKSNDDNVLLKIERLKNL